MELDQLALLESKDGLTKVDIFSWSGKFLISGSLTLFLPCEGENSPYMNVT